MQRRPSAVERPHPAHRRPMLAAVAMMLAAMLLLLSGVVPGMPTMTGQAAEVNLVQNSSLEDGDGVPDCFTRSGWGTEGNWSSVDGRTGGRAISLSVSGYQSGDRKLLPAETSDCAPAVAAGQTYKLGIWYRSTVPVSLTLFRHTPEGWSYWGDLKTVPAQEGWTLAEATTPMIPDGTDQLAFGLALAGNGILVTDDYSLVRTVTPDPPADGGELVVNGHLSEGSPVPHCFQTAGWGERQVSSTLSTDVPAGAEPGSRTFEFVMTSHASGDAKLIQSAAPGCAPSVLTGEAYDLSIDYRSTTDRISLTAFVHTADGWQYWTELSTVPSSAGWTTVQARTPEVPDGVDRLAFGVSLFGPGTLKTTGYSLRHVVPEPPPPAGDPALVGSWDVLQTDMPIRTIHSTLLHDGRLLLIAGSGNDGNNFAAGSFRAVVWDPATDDFLEVPVPYDMFCAGHVTLPDGKVLLAGGTLAFPEEDQGPATFKGSDRSYYFDPEDDTFHPLSDMAGAHWYPTLTKLGNGDVWAAGGLDERAEGTVLTEMFDVSAMRWLPQGSVPQTWSYWGTYPHMFLLQDGRLFYTGGHTFGNGLPGTGASVYDWRSAQIWDVPGLRQKDLRDQAGSVFIGPVQDQRLMIVGGGNTDANVPAINLVDIIDLSGPDPSFVPGPSLPGPGKMYVNVVNLPDRTVLAANGAQLNRSADVHTAAVYDPQTDAWTSVDPDPVGRNYHSTAILLPDGRVAVLGSNPMDNSFEFRISVYSPPYLFRGERPTIVEAPDTATHGAVLGLEVEGDVVSASLMSPMSSTHQTDTNARLVDLPLAGTGSARTVQVPANQNLVPPGPYMLTVVDSSGVPSVAEWVWVS